MPHSNIHHPSNLKTSKRAPPNLPKGRDTNHNLNNLITSKPYNLITSKPNNLITFEVRLLPSHPVEGDKLSFRLTLDGTDSEVIEYQTYGRSEEWKQNILRGYAVRKVQLPVNGTKKHSLTFTPLTPGVVLQEIRVTN